MDENMSLLEICKQGKEEEVIIYLTQSLSQKSHKAISENANLKAAITAIRKINRGKNESIDALCEGADYT